MKTHRLNVQLRTQTGKNENSRLRRMGFIPAVVYSHGKAESIQVSKKEFSKLFRSHISESVLIDLAVENSPAEAERKVIVKDYQLDPVSDEVVHLDFYKVTSDEVFQTKVPLIITGTSKGERLGGILEVLEREIAIECLPADLPEKIEIDVTNLEMGHSIHIKDLPASGTVKFLEDADKAVVAVVTPKAAKEDEVAAVETTTEEAVAEEAAPEEKEKPKEKSKEKSKE
jgi:large subunit ribosomal protein L25